MNKNTNCEHHIHGVHCDVSNCVYNDDNKLCTAKEISVGPQYASNSSDTVCATFKSVMGSVGSGYGTMM